MQDVGNIAFVLPILEQALRDRGYCLVGCSYNGVNAVFVRNSGIGDHFEAPFTAENHFNPARYELIECPNGHPASYKTLEDAMSNH